MKRNILAFSHSAGFYGAEKAFFEEMLVLNKVNNCIIILPENGILYDKFREKKIKVLVIPFKNNLIASNKIKNLVKHFINLLLLPFFLFIIFKYKINLIWNNTSVIYIGVFLGILCNCNIIFRPHEFGCFHHNFKFNISKSVILYLLKHKRTIIIPVSNILTKLYRRKYKKKVFTCYQPVFVSQKDLTKKNNKNKVNCLMLTSLYKQKNIHLIIESFKILKYEYNIEKNITLTIFGNGDENYIKELNFLIKKFKLRNIKFERFTDNVELEILNHDVLINGSTFETFGRVLIESMKLRTLVVASNSMGFKELVGKDRGVLFRTNSSSDLARILSKVLKKDIDLKTLTENAFYYSTKNCSTKMFNKCIKGILENNS
ncbi:glycosyltransferase [Malaciobacter sp. WC5094]